MSIAVEPPLQDDVPQIIHISIIFHLWVLALKLQISGRVSDWSILVTGSSLIWDQGPEVGEMPSLSAWLL